MEIEVSHSMGEKGKKMGRVLADRIFKVLMSVDPSVMISSSKPEPIKKGKKE